MPHLFVTRRSQSARRLIAWAMLTAYATTAAGVPLPRFVATRANSQAERHPCQTHRCGCSTAEQCWKSCCCFTNKQKLAWAAEHGVTVPEFVVAAAKAEAVVQAAEPACCRAKRSCCEKSAHGRSSSATHDALPSATHDGPSTGAVPSSSCGPKTEAATKPSVVYVSLLESQRCRGTTPTWSGVAISLPPAPPVRYPAFDPLVRPAATLPSSSKPHVFSFPVVPPPRAA